MFPASLVICNDCMAYVFGFFFGKTPLIQLSPKKTWEVFFKKKIRLLLLLTLFLKKGIYWWWFVDDRLGNLLQLVPLEIR